MKKTRRVDWYLVGILVISAFLFGWGIWDAGSANSYYTAAITSMVQSWHNFWYGSLDPAGFITVDKPPVALWFMAISAKIFGVHGWSVVLPSVLAGIASVYLMYKLIAPKFGLWAGRIAALVMALTPTVVANERTNNMDAILVFFLLLAVYVLTKAVAKKNFWLVLLSFAIVGISFNVKMLQAFMILPAMLVFYWIAIKVPWKKRLAWLAAGMVSLGVFTLAYPMSVDSVNKADRPYIGSSQTDSLMELAFGYNGSERLLGQSTGTGGAFPGMGNKKKTTTTRNNNTNNTNNANNTNNQNATNNNQAGAPGQAGGQGGGQMPAGGPGGQGGQRPTGNGGPGRMNGRRGGMGGGGMGSAFAIGNPGPFRLFQVDLGSQIGWFLPLSILGTLAGLIAYRRRQAKWYQLSDQQKNVVLWAGWLVPIYGFFSVASFFHPYYTIMLAPAIAALTAIGVVAAKKMLGESKKENYLAKGMITVGLVGTSALQVYYAWSYYPVLAAILVVIAVALSVWWWLPKPEKPQLRLSRMILSALTVLVLPAWWALTPTIAHSSAQIPFAGPSLLSQKSSGMAGGMGSSVDTKLLDYTEKHQGNAKYLFGVSDASTASGYIIKSGKAVMALGGFNGTDPTMTLNQFKKLVAEGQIKYFVIGGRGKSSTGQIGKILTWVEENGKKVNYDGSSTSTTSTTTNNTRQGGGMGMMGGNQSSSLYDLSNADTSK
ncbi:glycosyltransferase family 39 protein [Leuconostocaceae bacterium ESL0723]|nr:glycosyltransferase family 39 protein [Leuconostocaceae bacterium ESL0723]